MKLYRYTVGVTDAYGVAKDDKDAYENRARVDHTFSFLPVTIEEVKVPGYHITVEPEQTKPDFDRMDRDQLKEWLTENNIDFIPQWGEQKLREAAQHA